MAADSVAFVNLPPAFVAGGTRTVDSNDRPSPMATMVLCQDEKVIQVVNPVIAGIGSSVQLCSDAQLAIDMLGRWRFDAVLVDCDAIPRGMDVIRQLRRSTSNRTSVAFALLERTPASSAFEAGATFVLNKPVSRDQARRVMRTARGLMMLGCRRYYRRPLVTPVTFVNSARHPFQFSTVNISEGGMRVNGPHPLSQGQVGTICLDLPDVGASIIARVEVVWSREQDSGLRFLNIANGGAAILRTWISRSFEEELAAMKSASQRH